MDLNQMIAISQGLEKPEQHASMAQDNANKTAFALDAMRRMPQEQPKEEPVRIPSLGALSIPN